MKCPRCKQGQIYMRETHKLIVAVAACTKTGTSFFWGKEAKYPKEREFFCSVCSVTWENGDLLAKEVTPELTATKACAYVKDPVYCPFCESDQINKDNLNCDRLDALGGYSEIVRDCNCETCGGSWREHFPLSGVTSEAE